MILEPVDFNVRCATVMGRQEQKLDISELQEVLLDLDVDVNVVDVDICGYKYRYKCL